MTGRVWADRETGVQARFLADRGFRRGAFLRLLLKQHGQTFVVRLAEKVSLETSRLVTKLRKRGLGGRSGYSAAVFLPTVDSRTDPRSSSFPIAAYISVTPTV